MKVTTGQKAIGQKAKNPFPNHSNKKRAKLDFAANESGDDDDISSASDDDDSNRQSEDEQDDEPLQAKKVRLAREYLAAVDAAASSSEDEAASDAGDDDIRGDALSRRLQKQRQIQEGTYRRKIAEPIGQLIVKHQENVEKHDRYSACVSSTKNDTKLLGQLWIESTQAIRYLRPFQTHKLTPTCVAISSGRNDTAHQAVSGCKDHSVVLWDVATEQRVTFLSPRFDPSSGKSTNRSNGQVWSVAARGDLVASGTRDGIVRLFDIRQKELVRTFSHAKAGITALAFTEDQQLLAASMDRCIRVYQTPERLLVETLYGHQAPVHDLTTSCSYPISVGADRTSRVWKLDTDSHLILRCPTAAADCIAGLSADLFATGHADGSLQTWRTRRKQAVNRLENAHGGAGITSLASVQDVVVSGSQDGWLQFYQTQEHQATCNKKDKVEVLTKMGRIPIHGCINQIAMTEKFMLAAVGQDHKWGRWERSVGAKNRIVMVPLVATSASENSNE